MRLDIKTSVERRSINIYRDISKHGLIQYSQDKDSMFKTVRMIYLKRIYLDNFGRTTQLFIQGGKSNKSFLILLDKRKDK